MALPALAHAAAAGAESDSDARSGVLDCWNQSKENTGNNRNRESEKQTKCIKRHFAKTGKILGREHHQKFQRTVGDSESDDTAHNSERETFKQQFADNLTPTCAKGGADREFAFAALKHGRA